MKLSSAYLCGQLSRQFEVKSQHGISGRDGYLRPFFCPGVQAALSQPMYEGHVCVIPVRMGEQEVPVILKAEAAEMLLISCAEKIAADVLNCLQEVFDCCDEWDRQAAHLMAGQAGVGAILELTEDLLGNPLMVIGVDFTLVAETGTERLPKRARLFTEDGLNMEFMNALMQDKSYQNVAQTRESVLFPNYISGSRFMNRNLYVDGQLSYRLILTECDKPITDGDICILEELAAHLEPLLAGEMTAASNGDLEAVLEKIISDRTADYVQMSQRLSFLGWSEDHLYLCMILQLTYLNQKQISTTALCQYIRNQTPDSVSFLYQDEVVTFFNLTRLGMDEETAASKFTYFIRDTYLKAGYSRVMQGHMNLRRQYVQAGIALDVGSRKNPYLWIHHFNQVVLTYMTEQITRRLPADMLCHEGLLRLVRYDEENHTEYVLTLKTYLREHMNATQAARELFIHRSTFLYRLDRIREILRSDLDDPEEIFYLELSLRLLENKNV